MRLVPLLLLCSILASCKGVTTPTPLDQDFTLAPGDRATVNGTNLSIKFLRVENDSRCPADAICIQGGDALVKIAARTGSLAEAGYDLHTGSMAPVRHDDFTIALVQLQPYPFSGRTTNPDDYRATLRVAR